MMKKEGRTAKTGLAKVAVHCFENCCVKPQKTDNIDN